MGRLPIPEGDKKLRTIFYCTIAEGIALGRYLENLRQGMAPVEPRKAIIATAADQHLPTVPYRDAMTSPRECSICGKDYDGDIYTSCPHPHEVNNPGARKK